MKKLPFKNIVEAYKTAVCSAELNPAAKVEVFENVILFCEQDKICSREDSIKRNTLLFWAYNHLAQAKEKDRKYKQAVELWQKAYPLVQSAPAQIRLGLKMLDLLEDGNFMLGEKAGHIIKIALKLQQAYETTNQPERASQMERLRRAAEYVLDPPRGVQ